MKANIEIEYFLKLYKMICSVCSASSKPTIQLHDLSGNDSENIDMLFRKFGVQLQESENQPKMLCPQCYVTIKNFQHVLLKASKRANWNVSRECRLNGKNLYSPGFESHSPVPMDIDASSPAANQVHTLNTTAKSKEYDTIFTNCDIQVDRSEASFNFRKVKTELEDIVEKDKMKRNPLKVINLNGADDKCIPTIKLENPPMSNRRSLLQKKYRCTQCGLFYIDDICLQNHVLLKHVNCAHEVNISAGNFNWLQIKNLR